MVSDSDLVNRLREILGSSDLDTATAASVRRQLEEEFKVDLSDRKNFIRDQIDSYLQTLEEDDKEDNVENENDAVEDEERSNNVDKEVKKQGGGFNKLCSLSPQLQKLLGVSELARTQVVKKIWEYIKENNLQDPKNKKKILCDKSLQEIFRVNSIDMFQMNKALSKHIWPLTAENDIVEQKIEDEDNHDSLSEDNKPEEEEKEVEEDKDDENHNDDKEEEKKEEKSNKKGSKKKGSTKVDKDIKKRGGFTKLCSLSPELQTLVGVSELARTEVVKKLWVYIKDNQLQDPKNKQNILCDESLHALFRVSSINMFQMNKALSKHIWPLDKEDAPADSSQKEKRCKQEVEVRCR
ncbi:upstream activation factor subunit spp27-like isoform X3 [Mangifera indica]|uniref:upstream activation factor subunit spp27-like isoform X3 n=1 Tax=Mangifera indica TaxID=29780 RepID=UPI001CF9F565|nr:upstream activation factor subunit spp27-like isoform X3 [Mangifera indica]